MPIDDDLAPDEKRFIKAKYGLDPPEVQKLAEENSRSKLRSERRLSGALFAGLKQTVVDRRILLSSLGLLAAYWASHRIDNVLQQARTIVTPVSDGEARELASLFERSLNDIPVLIDRMHTYKENSQFSAFEIVSRVLDYRRGGIMDTTGDNGTENFWDMRIPDDTSHVIHPFKNLLKSREYLRIGDADKARNALGKILLHNKNSLPQALNVEIMTAMKWDILKNDIRIDVLLSQIENEYGRIWEMDPDKFTKNMMEFGGPVAIIVLYHSSIVNTLRSGGDIVIASHNLMDKLKKISFYSKYDVSKECWNGNLFCSYFINNFGSIIQGLDATSKIIGKTDYFHDAPPIEKEIERAKREYDNQMMFAMFQHMENSFAVSSSEAEHIYKELKTKYRGAISRNQMFARRFGDIEVWLGKKRSLRGELLPIRSHFIFMKERTFKVKKQTVRHRP